MNRRLLLIFATFAAFVLSACAAEIKLLDETKLNDISLLTGEPCEAPCWNGITAGETRYRDAKLIIESEEGLKISNEPDAQEGNPGRIFDFAEGDNEACCQVSSRDGETVSSFFLQLAPNMNFGSVFDRLGEPDYVDGQQMSDEQGYLALIYTDIPLVVYAYVEKPATGALSVYSEVIAAMYLAESEIEQVLFCASMYSWNGFQSFSSYSEGEKDIIGEGFGDEELCPTS